jgi:hypothetical protein
MTKTKAFERKTHKIFIADIPESRFEKDMEALLSKGVHRDALFLVDGKKFSAHQFFLAARSEIFRGIFQENQ